MTNSEPTLSDYDKISQGFEIFKKYPRHHHYVAAAHDEIFAGPHPAVVSEEDIARLAELGWHPETHGEYFRKFV